MKKHLLLITILLFGWSSIIAQSMRHIGHPQNFEVLNTDPVQTKSVQNYSDGFEDYTNFSINFSPWTLIDVDGSETYGFEGIDFLNEYAPMSFIVFNPAATEPAMTDDDAIQPHSGNKFAACFASVTPPNNDWIISPEADLGTNSSLSFWVKSYTSDYGLERYRVGVSTSGTDPGDFTIISSGSYLEAPATAWQQKTFDLSQYDGQTVYIGIQCVSNDAFIFMLDDIELSTEAAEGSTLTGYVTDASTGFPIENALVSIAGLSTTTDINGNYTINNVPEGMLTADFAANVTSGEAPLNINFFDYSSDGSHTVSCSKTGYTTYVNNNVDIPVNGTLNLDISLSPNLNTGQMRFVLNWGATPEDLDSHLRTPEIEGSSYHVSYMDEGSATSAPYSALDVDDTDGYGPETITIYDMFSGTYQYYIHNFDETPDITTSQAVVQIYNDAGLLQTLQVPTTGTGLYWYVCDVNGSTGQLTIHNVIQENEPGATTKTIYPPKVKSTRDVVSWLWNFGDGTTSTLQNPSHTYTTAGSYTVSLTVSNGSESDTETKTSYITVSGGGGGTGTLTGMVTDAFNGEPIEGAIVSVAGLSTSTDASGNYLIENIPTGMLYAEFVANITSGEAPLSVNFSDLSSDGANTVSCSKTGYTTYINNQVAIPDGGSLTLNISLSTTLAEGQMRFVINWGPDPSDLDSHLKTPEIEGNNYHVYYSDPGSATAAPYAALDYDITSGYGPETITIYDFFSGTYYYYIYKYSGNGEITSSQAVVQIYNDAGILQTLQAPTTGTGRYWYVCDVNGSTGQLTIHNVIQETEPGNTKATVYPPKETTPAKDIISWQWNFGDGSTSTLQNPTHTYMQAGVYTVTLTVDNGTTSDSQTKTDYINVTGSAGTGSLTGMVTDALTGDPVEGAEVSVAGLSDITDAEGNYLIDNVPIGTLSANFNANPTSGQSPLLVNFFDQSTENSSTVTCSKTDYNTYSNNQVIIPQDGTLTLNISLSPTLATGQMRFVLNWGADPRDLDSHLNTPEIEGNTYHIYYSDQGNIESAPYAALDHDITSGYGPETMTIYEKFPGTYQYYIYKYAGDGPITASQAVVQIYGQNGLLQTLQVPTNGTGDYWYVCDINGSTSQLTIRNVIQDNAPGNLRFEMPEKTRNPLTITSWLWNFGDGNTASVQNPTHTYSVNGAYTVSLTVTDNNGYSNTETKTAFIQVGPQSLDEQEVALLKIYPQPADNQITIESEEAIQQIRITDLSGKLLLQKQFDTKKITLNVDFLKNGVYLILVDTERGMIFKKITVR
ncbi:MAG: PKD domain-containing protein [Bacteroidetes bacterium]|jgi:PKD repeat protein|nr:PKD domain-containing protein [Bacteroidota bacterium]